MSLRTVIQRSAAVANRRFASSAAVPKPPVPEALIKNNDFKHNFLNDPSTYPLMVIMTAASAFVVGASIKAIFFTKNVKILPSVKHEVIPKHSKRQKPIALIVSEEPITFHPEALKATRREEKGLGVDDKDTMESKRQ